MDYLNIIQEASLTKEEVAELSNMLGRFSDWYDKDLKCCTFWETPREVIGDIRWELKQLRELIRKFNNRAIDNIQDDDLKQEALLKQINQDLREQNGMYHCIETREEYEEINKEYIDYEYDKMRYCVLHREPFTSKRLIATARTLEDAFMISEQIPNTLVTEQDGKEITKEAFEKYKEEKAVDRANYKKARMY